uniref:Uncharacterized protein n=1 Tax=Panagrolaimus davidi TaxID=227884 RepID=A0A914P8Z8_9BILA
MCFGKIIFLVCFEGAKNGSYSTPFCDSKCGFYVNTDGEIIKFMEPWDEGSGGRERRDCTEMLMEDKRTLQKDSPINYNTCLPKVENGIVKLNIMNATSDCVVSIKNAKIRSEDIIATSEPNSPPNNPPSDPSSAATKIIGNFGWIFAFISFCILYQ